MGTGRRAFFLREWRSPRWKNAAQIGVICRREAVRSAVRMTSATAGRQDAAPLISITSTRPSRGVPRTAAKNPAIPQISQQAFSGEGETPSSAQPAARPSSAPTQRMGMRMPPGASPVKLSREKKTFPARNRRSMANVVPPPPVCTISVPPPPRISGRVNRKTPASSMEGRMRHCRGMGRRDSAVFSLIRARLYREPPSPSARPTSSSFHHAAGSGAEMSSNGKSCPNPKMAPTPHHAANAALSVSRQDVRLTGRLSSSKAKMKPAHGAEKAAAMPAAPPAARRLRRPLSVWPHRASTMAPMPAPSWTDGPSLP